MATNTAPRPAGAGPFRRLANRFGRSSSYPRQVSLACCGVLVAGAAPWVAFAALNGAPWPFLAFAACTLVGVCGLFHLVLEQALRPVQLSLGALRAYRAEGLVPNLPTTERGTAGLLMAQLQETICELESMHAELRRDAETDHLTGVANRRWFFQRAGEEMGRARRTGGTFSLILLDLDRFKRFNDQHGHAAGDQVLRAVATCVRQSLRGYDCLARLGGEEFVILLPEAGMAGAWVAAERLRERIAALAIPAICGDRATASLGVVQLEPSDRRIEDLLDRADLALYEAKEGGRDRVVPLKGTSERPEVAHAAAAGQLPARQRQAAGAAA